MELRFSFQRPCILRNRAGRWISVASRGGHFSLASGPQTMRWIGSASRRESNRFSARAEDAIRSVSSSNPFLRGEESFLERSADAERTESPCRCDLRRSPMPERDSSSSAAAAAALRRDADTTFSVRRVKKLFGLFHSQVGAEPSRAATRRAAFCATLRGFKYCFPHAPQCLSAPRRALTTMGLNAVNRDPSISSSYHPPAPAAGRLVSGSTRGDHK